MTNDACYYLVVNCWHKRSISILHLQDNQNRQVSVHKCELQSDRSSTFPQASTH